VGNPRYVFETCLWGLWEGETKGKGQEEGGESLGDARRRIGRARDVSLETSSSGRRKSRERGAGRPYAVYVACEVTCEVFGGSERGGCELRRVRSFRRLNLGNSWLRGVVGGRDEGGGRPGRFVCDLAPEIRAAAFFFEAAGGFSRRRRVSRGRRGLRYVVVTCPQGFRGPRRRGRAFGGGFRLSGNSSLLGELFLL